MADESTLPVAVDRGREARQRRDRVNLLMGTMTEQCDKVVAILRQAQDNDDHLALGYASWTDYMAGEYADSIAGLNRAARGEVVGSLTAIGMPTRAIARIVGVDHSTVVRDQKQVVHHAPPGDDLALPFECGRHCTHSPICQRVKKTPQKITGLDGKAYAAPSRPVVDPGKPRQHSLPDQYRTAIWELDKAVRRLEKLHSSDRFTANRRNLEQMHNPLLIELCNKMDIFQDDLRGGLND